MTLVIFDCDGTIVDSQNGIYAAMLHAFAALDIPPPSRAATMGVIGLSLPEAFEVLAPEAAAAARRALAEHYKASFLQLRDDPAHQEPLFPGAGEVIAALAARADIRLGIATGKSRRGVARLFDRERWHDRFVTVQTADDHPSKPHPAMLLAAMAEAASPPGATVMIGDTTYDMRMARAAGVGALGVTWGYHPSADLTASGAHLLVDDYAAVPEAIERVLRQLKDAA